MHSNVKGIMYTVRFARYSSCWANSTKLYDIHTLQKIDCEDNTVTAGPLPYGQQQMFVLAKEKSRVDPDHELLNAEAPSLITSCDYIAVRRLNLMKIRVSLCQETHTTPTFQQSLWWWHCKRWTHQSTTKDENTLQCTFQRLVGVSAWYCSKAIRFRNRIIDTISIFRFSRMFS